jgi:hypothetical protein
MMEWHADFAAWEIMSGHMFRTRFRQQIVAEFLPPPRPRKAQRLIILCDGMPSIPRKQPLSGFLAAQGFWIIYPRYRGAWESGGQFLEKSPHEDILDIIHDLPKGMDEIASGRRFPYRRIESSSSEEASVVPGGDSVVA